MWSNVFEEIYCLTLRSETNRHSHFIQELDKVGIEDYEVVYGVTPEDEVVKNAYRENRVLSFPPCFRCGKDSCCCENNILIPSQIANYISFLNVFEKAINSERNTFLLIEDDVEFEDYADELAEHAFDSRSFKSLQLYSPKPTIIGLGQNYFGTAPKESRTYNGRHHWTGNEPGSLCNVLFGFNRAYADLVLKSMKGSKFATTSDIYFHGALDNQCNRFTLYPRSAHDLSWSTGGMRSTIHPKRVFAENERNTLEERVRELNRCESHVQRVSTKEEYESFVRSYLDS
jgi:hypothetical protein